MDICPCSGSPSSPTHFPASTAHERIRSWAHRPRFAAAPLPSRGGLLYGVGTPQRSSVWDPAGTHSWGCSATSHGHKLQLHVIWIRCPIWRQSRVISSAAAAPPVRPSSTLHTHIDGDGNEPSNLSLRYQGPPHMINVVLSHVITCHPNPAQPRYVGFKPGDGGGRQRL
jgi:hypothetical protein